MIKEQDRAVHPNLMFFPVILLVALVIAAISVFYPELVIVGIGLVIVGAITLWVSVRWPEVFLILALWTNFMKAAYIPGMAVGEFGATPYMTFTVLATIGFIVQVLTRKRRLILPVGLWFLLLFLSFTTISLLIVQDFRIAIGTYARALLDWMVFFSLVQMLTNHRRVQQIINALLIQALVVVGWGIFAGIQLELSGFVFRSIFFWQQFPKNDFAAYLGIVLVLALATFILAKVWYKKLFPLFLLLAVPIGWMFTFSRGGFLAILVCLIIFLVLERNKQILQRSFITIIIVGLLGLGFVTFSPSNAKNLAVDGLQSIVTGESEAKRHTDTIAFRFELARAAVEIITKHPLLGVGFNQWQFYSPYITRVYDPQVGEFRETGYSVHNRFLLIAANSGLIALIGYIGFIFVTLVHSLYRKNFANAYMRTYLHVFIAAVLGIQVALLFTPSAVWEWPVLGIATGVANVIKIERRAVP